jgi:hypothetical protein
LENYFFYVKIFDWNYLHLTAQTKETYFSYKLVVVGGGAGGCSTAAKFASKYPGQVAVIEPRDVRFFKPILIRYINYGNTGCGVFLRGEK